MSTVADAQPHELVPSAPTATAPSRSAAPTRAEPTVGGHVTVRVADYDEHVAAPVPKPDGLGRFPVVLRRQTGSPVRVTTPGGGLLGHLPQEWSDALDYTLRRCEARGVDATARAALAGRRDERDLFVLLAWPGRQR